MRQCGTCIYTILLLAVIHSTKEKKKKRKTRHKRERFAIFIGKKEIKGRNKLYYIAKVAKLQNE